MNRILMHVLAAAALLAAAPLGAQPFRSDVTGPIPTGSGIAGYPVVPTRDVEGALFRQLNGRTAFRTSDVANALLGEAAMAVDSACAARLRRPEHWPQALDPDSAAQRVICRLMRRPGMDNPDAQHVLAALRGCPPGPHGDPAEVLVAALAGILVEEPGYLDDRQRYRDGARWEAAFRAYEAYLAAAPDALMDPPPSELVAIGLVLDRVVDAGLRAAER